MNVALVRKLTGVGLTAAGLILLLVGLAGKMSTHSGDRAVIFLGGVCCVLGALFLAFEFFTSKTK